MKFELYPFQADALAKVNERLAEGHRPIVCAPTGSGKTVIAAKLAQEAMERGLRVLWMTGREEIIRQAYATFSDVCGVENVGVLCAGLGDEAPWWFYPKVSLASWDTLKARWFKDDAWKIPADVVMYDEAHLSLSKRMSETIIPHYEERKVIGFTATPARKSGKGLGAHYTRIIQVRRVQDIIDDDYLAAPEYWAGSHADTSKVSTDYKTGDYKQNELGALHRDGVLIGDVIDNWLRLAKDRHTIVFGVDIAHAQALAERFQAVGIQASAIHSQMTHHTRIAISEQFRRMQLQVLVNVGIATYGYDVPEIRAVVVARPTKSIVLWHQMVGRGLRPKPDGDHCMVLDHGDNVRRLGCIEDEIRWRLDEGKEAATNTTREGDPTRDKKPDAPPIECAECHHIFARSRVCPKCGWEKPAAARGIETVEADLVKVRKSRKEVELASIDRRAWFQMARGWCAQHNKKPGMAFYRYRDKFSENPNGAWWGLPSIDPDMRVDAYMRASLIRYAKRKKKEQLQEARA